MIDMAFLYLSDMINRKTNKRLCLYLFLIVQSFYLKYIIKHIIDLAVFIE